jgi:hypothetical protein
MNMQAFRTFWIAILFICITSCTREEQIIADITIENIIYGVNDVPIYSSNVQKNKQKSNTQYLSTVYSDLYQTTIPGNDLVNLTGILRSSGDKIMMSELIINNFLNEQIVQGFLPTQAEMHNDIDVFINNTYIRFYLRIPTELEKHLLKTMIEKDSGITPEMIYLAFSSSNEYWFY